MTYNKSHDMRNKELLSRTIQEVKASGGQVKTGSGELRIRKIGFVECLMYKDIHHIKMIGAIDKMTGDYIFPQDFNLEQLKNCHMAVTMNQLISVQ